MLHRSHGPFLSECVDPIAAAHSCESVDVLNNARFLVICLFNEKTVIGNLLWILLLCNSSGDKEGQEKKDWSHCPYLNVNQSRNQQQFFCSREHLGDSLDLLYTLKPVDVTL